MIRNMHPAVVLAVGAAVLVLGTNAAVAAPTYCPATQHYYDVITDHLSWFEARDAAAASELYGVHGHLAVLTSDVENLFIKDTFYPAPGGIGAAWIGGFQPPGTPEPDVGWEWVTGEAWDYTTWSRTTEPSDSGSGEDCLAYGFEYYPGWGEWNDLPAVYTDPGVPGPGYIVEYPVPEPGVAVLLCAGAMTLLRRRRGRTG